MSDILLLNGNVIYGHKLGATQEELDVMSPQDYAIVDEIPQELVAHNGPVLWDFNTQSVIIPELEQLESLEDRLARMESDNLTLMSALAAVYEELLSLKNLGGES
jgi:hypothetical protein